jgi:cytochrome P450/NADPH-cytochrome P450 reductase
VGVVNGPARSGKGSFTGVCSNYLARLSAGDAVQAFVRDPQSPFRLPVESEVPLIMVGPGTGFAPFRGFLQERAARQAEGETLGPALVFCGCRNPGHDFLYSDELREFEQNGVARIVTAFSRLAGQPKRYVQDEIRERGDEVWGLMHKGARVYVCGDASKMAPDVRRVFAEIFRAKTGAGEQTAEAWLNELAADQRYVIDVWAAS